ncbi:hypothetical protein KR51_00023480 [Rubidibacter lacunae KORDI 51-2]|uniref:Uncharacterized protein n=1 Tax=Rubidibacter lacunae KORDI 51-2 TaxID=582515 RepID=U5D942_9CHRO|nr:hypothetical protein [Rubidibacter lacunae]ERN41088.1 hypothetical protein KR51_00023480 [Rubidibacter lacunae KORDI 51-2]
MRLQSNTIGYVDNPTEKDIQRSFHDEWEDVAGNFYALIRDDGTTLCSISGNYLKDFSLTLGNQAGLFQICQADFSRDEAEQYFLRFFRGDDSWIEDLEWKEKRRRSLVDMISSLFKKERSN